MSDRERWIVYPLLFLALGASLRDKLIKSTESQRIKCQGLMVYDSTGQPLLVLGHEYFADQLPANAKNFMQINELRADRVSGVSTLSANTIQARKMTATESTHFGTGIAQNVISRNYYLTDGKNSFRIDGRFTVPIWQWLMRNTGRSAGLPPGEGGKGPTNRAAAPDAAAPNGVQPTETGEEQPPNPSAESASDDSAATEVPAEPPPSDPRK